MLQVVAPAVPVQTPDFLSPEVLAAMDEGSQDGYGSECDWWSLGVIAYEMIYMKLPFTDSTSRKTMHNIRNFQVVSPKCVNNHNLWLFIIFFLFNTYLLCRGLALYSVGDNKLCGLSDISHKVFLSI